LGVVLDRFILTSPRGAGASTSALPTILDLAGFNDAKIELRRFSGFKTLASAPTGSRATRRYSGLNPPFTEL